MINSDRSFDQFGSLRDGLLRVLDGAAKAYREIGDASSVERLCGARKTLADKRFRVVFMGRVKRGKSTTINALLGERILPDACSIGCTAVPIAVRYGETSRGICYDKSEAVIGDYDLSEGASLFVRLITLHDEESDGDSTRPLRAPVEGCRRAERFTRNALLSRGVEFVDTPGLKENAQLTERTWSELQGADAVVYVADISAVTEEDNLIDLERIVAGGHDARAVFVVWNRLDALRAPAEQITRAKAKAISLAESKGIPAAHVAFVSAADALEAHAEEHAENLQASGIPEFERALGGFLVERRSWAKLANSLSISELEITRAGSEVGTWREKYREQLNREDNAAQRAREAKQRAVGIAERVQHDVQHINGVLRQNLKAAVSSFLDDNRSGLERVVYEFELSTSDAVFSRRAAIENMALAAQRWLIERGQESERRKLLPLFRQHESDVRELRRRAVSDLELVAENIRQLEEAVCGSRSTAERKSERNDDPTEGSAFNGAAGVLDGVRSEGPEDELSFFWGTAAGGIAGSLFGGWLCAASSWNPILFSVVASIGAIVGSIRAVRSVKDAVWKAIEDGFPKLRSQLEMQAVRSVDPKLQELCDGVCGNVGVVVAEIDEVYESIRARLERTKSIVQGRQDKADELLEQLYGCKAELSQLEREIDPTRDLDRLVARIGSSLNEQCSANQVTEPGDSDTDLAEQDKELGQLNEELGPALCGRLDAVRRYFEKFGKWQSWMDVTLARLWVEGARKIDATIEKRKGSLQPQVFRIVTAIAVVEGESTYPSLEEIRRRCRQDEAFQRHAIGLSVDLVDEVYAKRLRADLLDDKGRAGQAFCKTYQRGLFRIDPESEQDPSDCGSVIDGKWER